ncbi:hypothetical protein EGW08_018908 [Elysia chlorotica]|uniref:Uncharacterized protein n=1 Tax=Elysia chlorotica TaxID=188477 RepID=A0A433SVQ6_ELYCH|nr:hypothetical protein EGW08_018908 [Elysia chlorotica]
MAQKTVQIVEQRADDPSVQKIDLSEELKELLINNPISGRSDYRDLDESFSRDQSLGEPNTLQSREYRRALLAEQRQQRNAESRRKQQEKRVQLMLKKEKQRIWIRERRRQKLLLAQQISPTPGKSSDLASGVIISSPQPKKQNSKRWSTNWAVTGSESSHGSREKLQTQRDKQPASNLSADGEVSTTTAGEESSDANAKRKLVFGTCAVGSTAAAATSSHHDSGAEGMSACDLSKSPADSTTGEVWVATALSKHPERADADSSTGAAGLNLKIVRRWAMRDDFSSSDDDAHEYVPVKHSRTSGRTIKPVERRLEKAVVDASMTKRGRRYKRKETKVKTKASENPTKDSDVIKSPSGTSKQARKDRVSSSVKKVRTKKPEKKLLPSDTSGISTALSEPTELTSVADTKQPSNPSESLMPGFGSSRTPSKEQSMSSSVQKQQIPLKEISISSSHLPSSHLDILTKSAANNDANINSAENLPSYQQSMPISQSGHIDSASFSMNFLNYLTTPQQSPPNIMTSNSSTPLSIFSPNPPSSVCFSMPPSVVHSNATIAPPSLSVANSGALQIPPSTNLVYKVSSDFPLPISKGVVDYLAQQTFSHNQNPGMNNSAASIKTTVGATTSIPSAVVVTLPKDANLIHMPGSLPINAPRSTDSLLQTLQSQPQQQKHHGQQQNQQHHGQQQNQHQQQMQASQFCGGREMSRHLVEQMLTNLSNEQENPSHVQTAPVPTNPLPQSQIQTSQQPQSMQQSSYGSTYKSNVSSHTPTGPRQSPAHSNNQSNLQSIYRHSPSCNLRAGLGTSNAQGVFTTDRLNNQGQAASMSTNLGSSLQPYQSLPAPAHQQAPVPQPPQPFPALAHQQAPSSQPGFHSLVLPHSHHMAQPNLQNSQFLKAEADISNAHPQRDQFRLVVASPKEKQLQQRSLLQPQGQQTMNYSSVQPSRMQQSIRMQSTQSLQGTSKAKVVKQVQKISQQLKNSANQHQQITQQHGANQQITQQHSENQQMPQQHSANQQMPQQHSANQQMPQQHSAIQQVLQKNNVIQQMLQQNSANQQILQQSNVNQIVQQENNVNKPTLQQNDSNFQLLGQHSPRPTQNYRLPGPSVQRFPSNSNYVQSNRILASGQPLSHYGEAHQEGNNPIRTLTSFLTDQINQRPQPHELGPPNNQSSKKVICTMPRVVSNKSAKDHILNIPTSTMINKKGAISLLDDASRKKNLTKVFLGRVSSKCKDSSNSVVEAHAHRSLVSQPSCQTQPSCQPQPPQAHTTLSKVRIVITPALHGLPSSLPSTSSRSHKPQAVPSGVRPSLPNMAQAPRLPIQPRTFPQSQSTQTTVLSSTKARSSVFNLRPPAPGQTQPQPRASFEHRPVRVGLSPRMCLPVRISQDPTVPLTAQVTTAENQGSVGKSSRSTGCSQAQVAAAIRSSVPSAVLETSQNNVSRTSLQALDLRQPSPSGVLPSDNGRTREDLPCVTAHANQHPRQRTILTSAGPKSLEAVKRTASQAFPAHPTVQRVAMDYPLTNAQIKKEFASSSNDPPTKCLKYENQLNTSKEQHSVNNVSQTFGRIATGSLDHSSTHETAQTAVSETASCSRPVTTIADHIRIKKEHHEATGNILSPSISSDTVQSSSSSCQSRLLSSSSTKTTTSSQAMTAPSQTRMEQDCHRLENNVTLSQFPTSTTVAFSMSSRSIPDLPTAVRIKQEHHAQASTGESSLPSDSTSVGALLTMVSISNLTVFSPQKSVGIVSQKGTPEVPHPVQIKQEQHKRNHPDLHSTNLPTPSSTIAVSNIGNQSTSTALEKNTSERQNLSSQIRIKQEQHVRKYPELQSVSLSASTLTTYSKVSNQPTAISSQKTTTEGTVDNTARLNLSTIIGTTQEQYMKNSFGSNVPTPSTTTTISTLTDQSTSTATKQIVTADGAVNNVARLNVSSQVRIKQEQHAKDTYGTRSSESSVTSQSTLVSTTSPESCVTSQSTLVSTTVAGRKQSACVEPPSVQQALCSEGPCLPHSARIKQERQAPQVSSVLSTVPVSVSTSKTSQSATPSVKKDIEGAASGRSAYPHQVRIKQEQHAQYVSRVEPTMSKSVTVNVSAPVSQSTQPAILSSPTENEEVSSTNLTVPHHVTVKQEQWTKASTPNPHSIPAETTVSKQHQSSLLQERDNQQQSRQTSVDTSSLPDHMRVKQEHYNTGQAKPLPPKTAVMSRSANHVSSQATLSEQQSPLTAPVPRASESGSQTQVRIKQEHYAAAMQAQGEQSTSTSIVTVSAASSTCSPNQDKSSVKRISSSTNFFSKVSAKVAEKVVEIRSKDSPAVLNTIPSTCASTSSNESATASSYTALMVPTNSIVTKQPPKAAPLQPIHVRIKQEQVTDQNKSPALNGQNLIRASKGVNSQSIYNAAQTLRETYATSNKDNPVKSIISQNQLQTTTSCTSKSSYFNLNKGLMTVAQDFSRKGSQSQKLSSSLVSSHSGRFKAREDLPLHTRIKIEHIMNEDAEHDSEETISADEPKEMPDESLPWQVKTFSIGPAMPELQADKTVTTVTVYPGFTSRGAPSLNSVSSPVCASWQPSQLAVAATPLHQAGEQFDTGLESRTPSIVPVSETLPIAPTERPPGLSVAGEALCPAETVRSESRQTKTQNIPVTPVVSQQQILTDLQSGDCEIRKHAPRCSSTGTVLTASSGRPVLMQGALLRPGTVQTTGIRLPETQVTPVKPVRLAVTEGPRALTQNSVPMSSPGQPVLSQGASSKPSSLQDFPIQALNTTGSLVGCFPAGDGPQSYTSDTASPAGLEVQTVSGRTSSENGQVSLETMETARGLGIAVVDSPASAEIITNSIVNSEKLNNGPEQNTGGTSLGSVNTNITVRATSTGSLSSGNDSSQQSIKSNKLLEENPPAASSINHNIAPVNSPRLTEAAFCTAVASQSKQDVATGSRLELMIQDGAVRTLTATESDTCQNTTGTNAVSQTELHCSSEVNTTEPNMRVTATPIAYIPISTTPNTERSASTSDIVPLSTVSSKLLKASVLETGLNSDSSIRTAVIKDDVDAASTSSTCIATATLSATDPVHPWTTENQVVAASQTSAMPATCVKSEGPQPVTSAMTAVEGPPSSVVASYCVVVAQPAQNAQVKCCVAAPPVVAMATNGASENPTARATVDLGLVKTDGDSVASSYSNYSVVLCSSVTETNAGNAQYAESSLPILSESGSIVKVKTDKDSFTTGTGTTSGPVHTSVAVTTAVPQYQVVVSTSGNVLPVKAQVDALAATSSSITGISPSALDLCKTETAPVSQYQVVVSDMTAVTSEKVKTELIDKSLKSEDQISEKKSVPSFTSQESLLVQTKPIGVASPCEKSLNCAKLVTASIIQPPQLTAPTSTGAKAGSNTLDVGLSLGVTSSGTPALLSANTAVSNPEVSTSSAFEQPINLMVTAQTLSQKDVAIGQSNASILMEKQLRSSSTLDVPSTSSSDQSTSEPMLYRKDISERHDVLGLTSTGSGYTVTFSLPSAEEQNRSTAPILAVSEVKKEVVLEVNLRRELIDLSHEEDGPSCALQVEDSRSNHRADPRLPSEGQPVNVQVGQEIIAGSNILQNNNSFAAQKTEDNVEQTSHDSLNDNVKLEKTVFSFPSSLHEEIIDLSDEDDDYTAPKQCDQASGTSRVCQPSLASDPQAAVNSSDGRHVPSCHDQSTNAGQTLESSKEQTASQIEEAITNVAIKYQDIVTNISDDEDDDAITNQDDNDCEEILIVENLEDKNDFITNLHEHSHPAGSMLNQQLEPQQPSAAIEPAAACNTAQEILATDIVKQDITAVVYPNISTVIDLCDEDDVDNTDCTSVVDKNVICVDSPEDINSSAAFSEMASNIPLGEDGDDDVIIVPGLSSGPTLAISASKVEQETGGSDNLTSRQSAAAWPLEGQPEGSSIAASAAGEDEETVSVASSECSLRSILALPSIRSRGESGRTSSVASAESSAPAGSSLTALVSSMFSPPRKSGSGGGSRGLSQRSKSASSSSGSALALPSADSLIGQTLADLAAWDKAKVAAWLVEHKLDKICPNLMNLDGRGLQRMAFEYWRDQDVFFQRIKKALGVSIFQAMVICKSMRDLMGEAAKEHEGSHGGGS